jgi:hypothetical protein
MAEQLYLQETSREERYRELYPQLQSLISRESNLIANLANTAAALRQAFGFFWVGFYLVEGDELVLGPFQGDIACTRIARGRGVCGTSWQTGKTLVVPDVEAFPGHIACSSSSRSEIVVPLRDISGEIVGVLDIDSDRLADFSEEVDRPALERIAEHLAPLFAK